MIDVSHVRKSFGAVRAVTDASFTAPDGTITGILGENGAGKTTTLAMICGLVQPDAGSIQVGPGGSTPLGRRRGVGALLDHKGLYERLTARENIAYFGALHGIRGAGLDDRVRQVLALLGLEQIADRRTAGFSQGERMKVALGRAIVHSPPHLLLDEPTNGLDIPTVHGFRDVLRRLRDRGTCIVFSSHVLDEVRALCDRVVIISHGSVVANGDATEICRKAGCAMLEEAFLRLTKPETLAS
jgi:sodium transport system ATP-binding protein